MSRIRQAVIAALKADASVQAVLGGRIYGVKLPDALTTWPAAAAQVISAARPASKDGPTGLVDTTVQVSVFGPDLGPVVQAASAVRVALDGYRGDMAGVRVHLTTCEGETDLYAPDAGVDGTFGIALEFRIQHEE